MKKALLVGAILLLALFCFSGCAQESDSRAATVRLNIETYLAGQNQPTHPSILGFDQPWHGYRYWLAYTPFPYANGEEENPCVAVSNDLFGWQAPKGLANPVAYNEETGCSELKDVSLLYREDLDQLELWYLGRLSPDLGGDGQTLLLLRKCSADGVHWSNYQVMAETAYLSPTVVWDGEKYRLWQMQYEQIGNGGTLIYQESADGLDWSAAVRCNITGVDRGLKLWHGAVRQIEDRYYFVYIKDYLQSQAIFCCESDNGIDFDQPRSIVDENASWFSYYRPDLLYTDGCFYLFYGVITHRQQRYIAMSYGTALDGLQGITPADQAKMTPLADEVATGQSLFAVARTFYQRLNVYISFKLTLLLWAGGLVAAVLLRLLVPACPRLRRLLLLGAGVLAAALYLLLHPTHAVDESMILLLTAAGLQGFLAVAAADFLVSLAVKKE